MSTLATIVFCFLAYLVFGMLLWCCVVFRYWRAPGRRGNRLRCLSIATRVALRWPVLIVDAAIFGYGFEFSGFSSLGKLRASRSGLPQEAQEQDEVGRSARVLRSCRERLPGTLVVDLVSSDFSLIPDRHSGGVVCSVIVDRWTIAQLTSLFDRVVRASQREFLVELPCPDDQDLRNARGYLHRFVEFGSPPIHPLVGAAIGSLVAASEIGDLSVMSSEEIDVIDAMLDFFSRSDGSRIARAVASVRMDLLERSER